MESLFGVLFSLHRGTSIHGDWVVACLKGAWPRLVGERLALVCRPRSFRGSELVVEILDDSWDEALRSIKEGLQGKLHSATAGEVKSVLLARGSTADD